MMKNTWTLVIPGVKGIRCVTQSTRDHEGRLEKDVGMKREREREKQTVVKVKMSLFFCVASFAFVCLFVFFDHLFQSIVYNV